MPSTNLSRLTILLVRMFVAGCETLQVDIAIFTDCYSPAINGVVTSIAQQVSVLRAMGHRVDLYCPDYPGEVCEEFGVYRLWAKPFPLHKREQVTFPGPPWVLRRICSEHYDLVHVQTPFSAGLLGLLMASCRGIPRIFHHHTLWEEYVDYLPLPKGLTSRLSVALCRGLANQCHGVVSPSDEVRRRFADQGVRAPIHTIPTGIKASRFQDGVHRPELQQGDEVCLYIGRVAHEKSLDVVLRVFARLSQERPRSRLWIVGDGPARPSLEQLAQELNLSEVCRFFGFVERDALRDFVASAKLFLFASVTETQGLVLLEAQAGGLPVVAVAASGVNEAVSPGQTGVLIQPGQEEEMALVAARLLADESLRAQMSEAAVEWSAKFSVEQMGEALVFAYEQAVETRWKPEK